MHLPLGIFRVHPPSARLEVVTLNRPNAASVVRVRPGKGDFSLATIAENFEIITPLTIQLNGHDRTLVPGEVLTLPDSQGEKLIARAGSKVRVITSTVQVGDQISWMRAGHRRVGQVDFLHVDSDGIVWAFCTVGESWAAVNLKFAMQP